MKVKGASWKVNFVADFYPLFCVSLPKDTRPKLAMVSVEWFWTIFVIFFQHYENVKKRYLPFYAALAEAKSYVNKNNNNKIVSCGGLYSI